MLWDLKSEPAGEMDPLYMSHGGGAALWNPWKNEDSRGFQKVWGDNSDLVA